MAKKKGKKKSSGIVIPMDQEVESGGGKVRWPEGDYKVKVVKAVHDVSSEKNTPAIKWTFKVLEGKKKGKEITDWTYLTPKSLWRVRALLEAIGVAVPKKAFKLDPSKVKDKELAITVEDDEYEGKIRSRVSDFIDVDTYAEGDVDDDEDEDDDDLDEDEDDDDEDEDDDDDEDEDEDLEEIDLDDDV